MKRQREKGTRDIQNTGTWIYLRINNYGKCGWEKIFFTHFLFKAIMHPNNSKFFFYKYLSASQPEICWEHMAEGRRGSVTKKALRLPSNFVINSIENLSRYIAWGNLNFIFRRQPFLPCYLSLEVTQISNLSMGRPFFVRSSKYKKINGTFQCKALSDYKIFGLVLFDWVFDSGIINITDFKSQSTIMFWI